MSKKEFLQATLDHMTIVELRNELKDSETMKIDCMIWDITTAEWCEVITKAIKLKEKYRNKYRA